MENDNNNNNDGIKIPDHIPKSILPLTPEEQSLLKLYDTIKSYEREATLAKSKATQQKLAELDEQYKRESKQQGGSSSPELSDNDDTNMNMNAIGDGDAGGGGSDDENKASSKKGKKRDRSNTAITSDNNGNQSPDYASDTDEEERERRRIKTEAKIAKVRNEIDIKERKRLQEEAAKQAEEERRLQYLKDNDDDDNIDLSGPSLKRKDRDYDDIDDDKRLIENLQVGTPPHDFSKSLSMSRITGLQLFPEFSMESNTVKTWSPPPHATGPDDGCLELSLKDFDAEQAAVGSGNNTVAIKFAAPSDSKRFSINIASTDHSNYHSVLFHFNPRQFQKGGQVVINDKQEGQWGQGINIPLTTLPQMFYERETTCTLIVQVNGDGFDVFLDGQHCARLEHRTPMPKVDSLVLQMPSTDDYGNLENWTVFKVWWGNKSPMAKGDLSHIPGFNTHDTLHKKKLFLSGLPKIHSEAEVDLRRAELERAFRKYGGSLGITAIVPTNSTFAFVEVETERMADLALADLAGTYQLNRARRSRHEALMEKRAMAEASGQSLVGQEKSEWG